MSNSQWKRRVLAQLLPGAAVSRHHRETFRVGPYLVHTRFKAKASNATNFPFNYGSEAFDADFELWVCGDTGVWYLLPSGVLKPMHAHPDAYPDRSRPNLRVLSVDIASDRAAYARGGLTADRSELRPRGGPAE